MISLRDDLPRRWVPLVTIGLTLLNVAVYLYELSLGVGGGEGGRPGPAQTFVLEFGATPCRLAGTYAVMDDFPTPVVTS